MRRCRSGDWCVWTTVEGQHVCIKGGEIRGQLTWLQRELGMRRGTMALVRYILAPADQAWRRRAS